MHFISPTHGTVDDEKLRTIIVAYLHADKSAKYEIIVGSDSQKIKVDSYDFVSALVIHRIGGGGIFFWNRDIVKQKMSLRERMYREAIRSLETSEHMLSFFLKIGISKYDIQIHVDIGPNGDTKDMITEMVGMIRNNGYSVKIKPDSFGASKVADRYT